MTIVQKQEPIINLLRQENVPEYKILHSMAVAHVAIAVAKEIQKAGHNLDLDTVYAGAMLHDSGISKTTDDASPNHALFGGEIARKHGFSEAVARCVENHEYVIASRSESLQFQMELSRDSCMPATWEEKAVSYADIVILVVEECCRQDAFLTDPECVQKATLPYWRDVFHKYAAGNINRQHPFMKRLFDFHQEMKGFVKPAIFDDPGYQEVVTRMREAQTRYGLQVPFDYVENLD